MDLNVLFRNEGGHNPEETIATLCESSRTSCKLQSVPDCEEEACIPYLTVLVFPFLALVIGTFLQPISRAAKLPYTLLLLISGIILGAIGCAAGLGMLGTSLRQWVHLDPPNAFFYVFLAPLIFEAAFNTEWHNFKRLLFPIMIAAFVIVAAQVGLIAAFQLGAIRSPNWDWTTALMFGAMLSATDPISVTATLKALGSSVNLGTLIEGESLLNDGTAFVLWEGFFESAKLKEVASAGEVIAGIIKSSVLGALLGVAFGFAALGVLTLVYDEFEVETSITLIVAFLGFWTAQAPCRLSGVICNVASGLTMSAIGRPLISKSVRHPLHEFWELVGWMANTVVFVHAGVMVLAFGWSCARHGFKDYAFIAVHFIYLQIIRFGLFGIFYPVMSWKNAWYTWKEMIVVSWSGLRGAVSLVLALEVAGAAGIDGEVRSRIVLWTTGLVFLSLVINGGFIGMVVDGLGMSAQSSTRKDFLKRARSLMTQTTFGTLDILCVDITFKSARWSYIIDNVLPAHWLEKEGHSQYYARAAESVIDNTRAHRQSLDMVMADQGRLSTQYNAYGGYGGRHSIANEIDVGLDDEPRRMSLSRPPKGHDFMREGPVRSSLVMPQTISPTGGMRFMGNNRASIDRSAARHRRSVDYDRHIAFCKCQADPSRIHQDLVALQQSQINAEGSEYPGDMDANQEEEVYREIQRRLLVGILAHIRALANSSFIEVSALVSLEQDVQRAIDANEEGTDYDLFSKLDHRSWYTKLIAQCYHSERLATETIVFASIVFSILSEVLKQDMLGQSPRLLKEVEQLYEGAAFVLNRLELLSPSEFSWVQSQFAIHITTAKQDAALDDMLASGQIDGHEYNLLKSELVEVRRRHSLRSRHNWKKMEYPRKLLPYHPIFLDPYFDKRSLAMLNLQSLHPGERINVEPGSLILVLQGAIRPLDDHLTSFITSASMKVGVDCARSTINSSGNGMVSHKSGILPGGGTSFHWCFPAFSAFCGSALAIQINNHASGELEAREPGRGQAQFIACDVAAETTVFCMPIAGVREAAKHSRTFREEVTRALAREIILESVTDQTTYDLIQIHEALANGLDENSVIGRAYVTLERLPYMSVIRLHAGDKVGESGSEMEGVHNQQILRGPGVLINGAVRVSIADTSGLIGATNLLHERLVGPALLPAGDLIIEEVRDGAETEDADSAKEGDYGRSSSGHNLRSPNARMYADAAQKILEQDAKERGGSSASASGGEDSLGPILAHVLVEAHIHMPNGVEEIAKKRLDRWTAHHRTVDMNNRYGMFRHIVNHGSTGGRYPKGEC